MIKRACLFALVLALLLVGVAGAQHPLLDNIATKVVQKYQQSSCEQLWQQKAQPKPPMEQNFIQMLRSDPQMRAEFINKVAAPMANKMFECGMIP
jgi:LPS O-antigen subunit length determinant protein (WzzB/FepE family)